MRSRSERLDVLESLVHSCLTEIEAIPSEDVLEAHREEALASKQKPGPEPVLMRALAKTKYIGAATTALKEMGSVVRKEYKSDGDSLEKEIEKEKNVDVLEKLKKRLTANAPRDGRSS